MKIHEAWHFPKDQRIEGLFADYVNTWRKMKQEASKRAFNVHTKGEL